jgi:hypothetical protein
MVYSTKLASIYQVVNSNNMNRFTFNDFRVWS